MDQVFCVEEDKTVNALPVHYGATVVTCKDKQDARQLSMPRTIRSSGPVQVTFVRLLQRASLPLVRNMRRALLHCLRG